MNVKSNLQLVISFLFMMFITVNCTGMSYGSLGGITTNPTPQYANPYATYYKGGGFYHNNTIPGQLGSNADGKNIGQACSSSVLYLVSWGDSSIEAAKKAGKISKVSSVEYEQTGILGVVYHSFCTLVVGSGDGTSPKTTVSDDAKTAADPAGKKPAKKGK